MVETLDIFPTIGKLTGLKTPVGLNGQSLFPILKNPAAKGHSAFAYKNGAQTIRTDNGRLIAHKSGQLELYDHTPVSYTHLRDHENVLELVCRILLEKKKQKTSKW